MIIDSCVESIVLDQPPAFVGAAGDADDAAALDLADLADHRSHRPGRTRDEQSLARLRLADLEQPEIGRPSNRAHRRPKKRQRVDMGHIHDAGEPRTEDRSLVKGGCSTWRYRWCRDLKQHKKKN